MTDERLRRAWLRRVPALLFVGAASFIFLRSYVYRAPRSVDLRQLSLMTLDGAPVDATRWTGRPVVLNFWAPWCAPCRAEMPAFERLQQSHPQITVLGIEDDEDALPQARGFAVTQGITYPLVQTNAEVRRVFGHVAALPTTLFLDAEGRVRHTATGALSERTMQRYLDDLERR